MMSRFVSQAFKKPANYEEKKTIHLAAKLGILEDVKKFVAEDKSNLTAVEGNDTPLSLACLNGHSSVVHYLLTMGARDNAQQRCFRNALTLEIREMLVRFAEENFYPSLNEMETMATQKIEAAFGALYDNCVTTKESFASVLSEIKRKVEGSMTKEEVHDLNTKRQFSDFKIVATSQKPNHDASNGAVVSMDIVEEAELLKANSSSAEQPRSSAETSTLHQQVFHCHLPILITRWKLLRKKYLYNTSKTTISDIEIERIVSEKVNQLKGKAMVIAGVHPFLVHTMLKYFYSNEFSLPSIKEFVLDTSPQNIDMKAIYKKAQETIVALLRMVSFFEEDGLIRLILEQCKAVNIKLDLQKLGVSEEFDHKRKRQMAAQFTAGMLIDPKSSSKVTLLASVPEQHRYEIVDQKVQQFGMLAASDITLLAGSFISAEEERQQTPEQQESNEASTTNSMPEKKKALSNNKGIPSHKVILSARCFLFKMMLARQTPDCVQTHEDGTTVLAVEECHRPALLQTVNYIYTETIGTHIENALEVLFLASRLSMDHLKNAIEVYLQSKLNKDNYLDMVKIGEMSHSTTLLRAALYHTRTIVNKDYHNQFKLILERLRALDLKEDTLNKFEMAVIDLKPSTASTAAAKAPAAPASSSSKQTAPKPAASSNFGRKSGRNIDLDY